MGATAAVEERQGDSATSYKGRGRGGEKVFLAQHHLLLIQGGPERDKEKICHEKPSVCSQKDPQDFFSATHEKS